MITYANQACFAKMSGYGLQEGVLIFQKAAGPDANLTLSPTYLQFDIRHVVEDYELKE